MEATSAGDTALNVRSLLARSPKVAGS